MIEIEIKVTGPGGCGKTTWLLSIAQDLQKKGFTVSINGDEHLLHAQKGRQLYQEKYYIGN